MSVRKVAQLRMKLTKQTEAEILKVYFSGWDAYFRGDLNQYGATLSKDFKIIGTSEQEQFSSKKDWLNYCEKTSAQYVGTVELRNRNIQLVSVGEQVLAAENSDLFVLIENKWTFYSKVRITTLFQKEKSAWKSIHQHGSIPDSKASEDQVLGIEQIKKENFELKEAVQRRTSELEIKNRELEIETALEKVRTVTMSMKQASDMLEICKTIAQQLSILGLSEIRNIQTAIFNPEQGTYVNYEYYARHDKTIITETSYTNHKIQRDFATQMMSGPGEFFYTQIKGKKNLKDWLDYQRTTNVFIDDHIESANSLNYYWHSLGPVASGISAYHPLTDTDTGLFKRFTKVFELAYRRYLDIETAGMQAREAQIELGLERVRARAMAMQKSEELSQLIATVYTELVKLDVVFDRCFIMIFDSKSNGVTWWIASHEAPSIQKGFFVQYHEHAPYLAYLHGWKNRQEKWNYIIEGNEKKNWDKFIFSETELSSLPPLVIENMKSANKAFLSASFNNFGCLTTGSMQPLTTEAFDILIRFGKVFEQTYTRFLDLVKAEAHAVQAQQDLIEIKAAKQKAELALSELQSTQKQLIQSEKMASLGELTAGIAHEIQNPLNFVNNFSEVSKELVEEMDAALQRGDEQEARDIARDLVQNLDKINHHGKRADSIVKGMLQHSRQSSGQKEPTDINNLVDEYVRLSYHGLRAKDNSFNAGIKTEFDPAVPAIKIVPQEIGRVILNILTNAFYAANEKKKDAMDSFQPEVFVATKYATHKVEISITDNGNGIGPDVMDKIFQPFFTTKPTGKGTGLGLSLSYDIVKAHGGELNVKTKQTEGTTFTIILPTK